MSSSYTVSALQGFKWPGGLDIENRTRWRVLTPLTSRQMIPVSSRLVFLHSPSVQLPSLLLTEATFKDKSGQGTPLLSIPPWSSLAWGGGPTPELWLLCPLWLQGSQVSHPSPLQPSEATGSSSEACACFPRHVLASLWGPVGVVPSSSQVPGDPFSSVLSCLTGKSLTTNSFVLP